MARDVLSTSPMAEQRHYAKPLVALALTAAAFAFQETAILPALPHIQETLSGSKSSIALLESAFLVVASMAAPLLGRLGDRYGKRRLMLITMGIYLVGAVGAALSPVLPALIAFRGLQGVGGAVFGLSFAVMRDVAGQRRLGIVIGVIVGAFGTGMAVAFALSGLLVSAASWHWIFWTGALLIVLASGLIYGLVPDAGSRQGRRIDVLGALLLGGAPSALVIALSVAPELGWISWPELVLVGVAVAFAILWIERERHTDDPLIDLETIAKPTVLLPNVGSFLAGWAAFSLLFLIPRFVQAPAELSLGYGFDASDRATGYYLVPFALGIVIGGPTGGLVGRAWSGKWPFTIGLALLGAACGLTALVHETRWLLLAWLLAAGIGFGATIGAAGTFVTESVDASRTGVATTFNSVARLIGGGIGAELAAGILAAHHAGVGERSSETGFVICFWIAAGVALVGAALALLVPRGNGGNEPRR